jgi:hypothetical protein
LKKCTGQVALTAETILLVFEGERTEPKAVNSIISAYELNFSKVEVIFESEIYQLYKIVKEDEDLDLVEILRDRNEENKDVLSKFSRNDFSQIFIFFDFDGHATGASLPKIEEMLQFFNNETEHGKLYISYPMIEAFRHLTTDFCKLTSLIAIGRGYKTVVGDSESKYKSTNYKSLSAENWDEIVLRTFKKATFMCSGNCSLVSYVEFTSRFDQLGILELQKENVNVGSVLVLSALPFFIVEYVGESLYNRISQENFSCESCSL